MNDGIISHEIREMAAEALLGDLPTTTISHERSGDGGQSSTGAPIDDWAVIRTFPGRIRQAKRQREEVNGEQVRAQADYECVCEPYPEDLPADKRIRGADRLVVRDGQAGEQVYQVLGDDAGRTGALLLTIQLIKIEGDR
jgi:hypothetical protein